MRISPYKYSRNNRVLGPIVDKDNKVLGYIAIEQESMTIKKLSIEEVIKYASTGSIINIKVNKYGEIECTECSINRLTEYAEDFSVRKNGGLIVLGREQNSGAILIMNSDNGEITRITYSGIKKAVEGGVYLINAHINEKKECVELLRGKLEEIPYRAKYRDNANYTVGISKCKQEAIYRHNIKLEKILYRALEWAFFDKWKRGIVTSQNARKFEGPDRKGYYYFDIKEEIDTLISIACRDIGVSQGIKIEIDSIMMDAIKLPRIGYTEDTKYFRSTNNEDINRMLLRIAILMMENNEYMLNWINMHNGMNSNPYKALTILDNKSRILRVIENLSRN
jgi:hypothetical protein